MKKFFSKLKYLPIVLPIVFVMVFFGYMPPKYDAIVYTDNIVGEGTCSSYLTDSDKSFSYLYQGDSYFGTELKTLRLSDLAYNVETVGLYIYGVEEADILSFDISMFGRTVSHVSKTGTTHPFTRTTRSAVTSEEEPIVHLTVPEGEDEMSLAFPGSSLIPKWIWIAYGALILLISVILTIGLAFLIERFPKILMPLLGASGIMLTMIMGCFLCDSLPYVSYIHFLLNWLVLFAAALLINALTLPWIGTVAVSTFTLFWYMANHYVILFRGKPVMPADLKAMGTAREVAGGYDLTPTWQIIISVIVVALYMIGVVLAWKKNRPQEKPALRTRLIQRGAGVVAAVLLLILSFNNPVFSQLNTFQWDAKVLEGFHREGIVLTFVKSALSAHVDAPAGYSRDVIDSYLKEYQESAARDVKEDSVRPTRIIMVMNEAFSDLRTVGLDKNIDVMPYIDSLDANTVEGRLYVSVLGGGTCNTEFEALTGNSLAFLSAGAYPYTENVTKPMFSLASYFGSEDYMTEAFHASDPQNWNRNMVYPNLGFDIFHSLNDFPSVEYLHNYITDSSDYNFIKQRDKENDGKPRFLFDVTIQNHADYDHFGDVKEAETLKPYEKTLHQNVRVYLSLLKVSDDSIRQMVEKYKEDKEPTMIVFFGDHQPMLPDAAQKNVYTDMQGQLDYFKSKFFIWTNYETKEEHDAAISANYLPWLVLDRGNFPLPPYVEMLKEVHDKYPVISSQGVIDRDGNVYESVAELLNDSLMLKYQQIQYANMFDKIDDAWFKVNQ